LWSGIYYPGISLTTGKYEKYSPAVSFDLRCQSVILQFINNDTIHYVTLSHLGSKEFQRIHKPCIPHHRDTSKCIQRASHFHQSKPSLDVDEDPLLVL